MFGLLNAILAPLIDKFKTNSPVVFAGTVAVLVGGYVGLDVAGPELIGEKLTEILKYVDLVITALVGSRTVDFIKDKYDGVEGQTVKKHAGD